MCLLEPPSGSLFKSSFGLFKLCMSCNGALWLMWSSLLSHHSESTSLERSPNGGRCSLSYIWLKKKKKNTTKDHQSQWRVYILSAVYTEWEAVGLCQVPLWCNGPADTVLWDWKVQQPVVHHWCSAALSWGERPQSTITETIKYGWVCQHEQQRLQLATVESAEYLWNDLEVIHLIYETTAWWS